MTTTLATVELCRPGWVAPRRVAAANVAVSWALNQPGRLSAFFPAGTRFPHGGEPKGLWLYYRHPIHGAWGGVVEDAPVDWQSGTVELAAVDFAQTLAHRLTPGGYVQHAATAGELAIRALSDSPSDDPLGWEVVADEAPPWISWEWRDDTALSVVTALVAASRQEWRVTVDARKRIAFEWRTRIGRDHRRKVLLCDGYGVGGRLDDSIAAVVNAIRATANDDRFAASARVSVEDDASIVAHRGRRWAARRYVGVGTKPTLEPRARADLADLAQAAITPDLVMAHTDPRGLLIREGDTVRLWSRAQGKRLDFRVFGREVNTAAGTVRIVGKAVAT